MKQFKTAPLPFMGQKRGFIKAFSRALDEYPKNAIYVDLFGGSGLLSHTVKRKYPNASVVYNDFDNYRRRLENVPKTNLLIAKLRTLTKHLERKKKIPSYDRIKILKVIEAFEQKHGFVDYITISGCLLFSMNYVESFEKLKAQTLYNRVRLSNYNADEYLDGLDIVCEDYKRLFHRYKNMTNVVFLIDPPYLSTEVGTYKNYWKLTDYLDVLDTLSNTSYFYFTSNKSNIVELCEWIEKKSKSASPFNGAVIQETTNHMNYNSKYTDIMIYKKMD
ncbi:DNA methyltransferase [Wenyingzhuangia fucanilytica]|uniref:DNA methyltransferase n=1 Tax=Wenyingzhuangia fucanilytica TaxID=1790137 RepID=A0A1B1Y7K9_9FLAO|nr:DNA methyltransferase [Wenyingzhuangia fucanilytica]ANW96737.1 DNA methyltransferase [Wenyingzhuangia fucanilytica]